MSVRWTILIMLLAGTVASGESVRLAQASLPTLDNAIYLSSRIDREVVYLGEAVTLTLEYWELTFRGVKVQSQHRNAGVVMPEMQGFYGAPVETEHEDATRDGALYAVTRHRQRLYPTVAGELSIGAWNWKGTVRGYTAAGARTTELDVSTDPLRVRVLPLPAPPSTFRGAVGEFEIGLALSSPEMTQGVPASLTIEMSGSGNPGTLAAPDMPEADWYSLGEPQEDAAVSVDPASGHFVKEFRYELMPLKAGAFSFPAVSFTYFSPAEKTYKSVRTVPVRVRVTASGPAEQLVVVGGGPGGPGAGGAALEHGKLALVPAMGPVEIQRDRPYVWPLMIALPPLAYLAVLVGTGGWRRLLFWRSRRPRRSPLATRLAAVAAPDAFIAIVRSVVAERFGDPSPGLSVPELQDWLAARVHPDTARTLGAVLQACQDHRYGKRELAPEDIPALAERVRAALSPLEAPSHWWGWRP